MCVCVCVFYESFLSCKYIQNPTLYQNEYEHPFKLNGKITKVKIGDIIVFSSSKYFQVLKLHFSAAIVVKFGSMIENNECKYKARVLILMTYVLLQIHHILKNISKHIKF